MRARAQPTHCFSHVGWIGHRLEARFQISLCLHGLGEETSGWCVGWQWSQSETGCRDQERREQRAHQWVSRKKKKTLKLTQRLSVRSWRSRVQSDHADPALRA